MAIKYGIAMRTNTSRRIRYNQSYNYKLYPNFGRIILIQYFTRIALSRIDLIMTSITKNKILLLFPPPQKLSNFIKSKQ